MRSGQEIIIIAAVAENGVIGKDNKMPWDIRGNLAHFREVTMGFPCIMGRKTWESLPKKPLPGRLNIIISKTMDQEEFAQRHVEPSVRSTEKREEGLDIKICQSIESAVELSSDYEKIFIIGGESIYKQAMPFATKIDLTLISGNYDGDTYFPKIDDSWIKSETVKHDEFSIITYIKKE